LLPLLGLNKVIRFEKSSIVSGTYDNRENLVWKMLEVYMYRYMQSAPTFSGVNYEKNVSFNNSNGNDIRTKRYYLCRSIPSL
jgi:hypothetical protein